MIVCGIDPSLTNTGIAILQDGQPVHLTSIGFKSHDGATYPERSDRIVGQCRAVQAAIIGDPTQDEILQRRIDLAVIEGPAYGHNLPSNHDRAGLWWGLYSALRARKIPTAVIAPGTRAKWATGTGRGTKTEVLSVVRSWWPSVRIANHDIADAAVLAAIGAHHAGDPMPFTPKERHTTGLEAVQWPALSLK